jgi:CBS domain-containing protein
MPVGDYCQRDVRTIESSESVRAAARKMADEGVGTLLVTTGRLLRGVVTDRDIALCALRDGLDPDTTPLTDVLSGDPAVAHTDTPLRAAAALMRRRSVRRLPVLDEKQNPVGVIASDDLLRIIAGELAGLAHVLAEQSPVRRAGADPNAEGE